MDYCTRQFNLNTVKLNSYHTVRAALEDTRGCVAGAVEGPRVAREQCCEEGGRFVLVGIPSGGARAQTRQIARTVLKLNATISLL